MWCSSASVLDAALSYAFMRGSREVYTSHVSRRPVGVRWDFYLRMLIPAMRRGVEGA
jgi:hypothetical protein